MPRLKLISDEVIEFIPSICRSDDPTDVPTVFGIKQLGKGQLDRMTALLERGVRKTKGKDFESWRVAELHKATWKTGLVWVKGLDDATGKSLGVIDDPKELAELYDSLPPVAVSEVIEAIQGMSDLDEDEAKNSPSPPDLED